MHEYLQEMNRKVLSRTYNLSPVISFSPPSAHDLITVGETPFTHSASELAKYVLPKNKELNMVFQFELVDIDSPRTVEHQPFTPRPWKLSEFKEIVNRWQTFGRDDGFWNAFVCKNLPTYFCLLLSSESLSKITTGRAR